FFFFSSRRRHTRWPRDWSSDVCSSDLRYYERIPRPDLVTVLVVDPTLAVQRKQNEPADYVRRRAELVEATSWSGSGAHVVDANRSEERRVGKESRAGRGREQ